MNRATQLMYMVFFTIICNLYSLYLLFHLFIKRLKAFFSNSNNTTNTTNSTSNSQPPKLKFIRHDPKQSTTPKDTLLLLHGFPDGPMLWDNTVDVLTKEGYRCIVVAFPSSGGEKVKVVPKLSEVLEELREVAEGEEGGMSVIAHDWGAFLGKTLVKMYPSLFKRAILLDIGDMNPKNVPLAAICALAYQATFALCYMVGEGAGSWVFYRILQMFKYKARPIEHMTIDMTFWYRMILPEMLNPSNDFGSKVVTKKAIPTMFVYGKRKVFMFHDEDWINSVRRSPCGVAVGLDCTHWITEDKPDEFNKLCVEWLEKTKSYSEAKCS